MMEPNFLDQKLFSKLVNQKRYSLAILQRSKLEIKNTGGMLKCYQDILVTTMEIHTPLASSNHMIIQAIYIQQSM